MNFATRIQLIENAVRFATYNVRKDIALENRNYALNALRELRQDLSRGWLARLARLVGFVG